MVPVGPNGFWIDTEKFRGLLRGDWFGKSSGLAKCETRSGNCLSCVRAGFEDLLVVQNVRDDIHPHRHLQFDELSTVMSGGGYFV
jgi:hypothetical protein